MKDEKEVKQFYTILSKLGAKLVSCWSFKCTLLQEFDLKIADSFNILHLNVLFVDTKKKCESLTQLNQNNVQYN